MKKGIFLTLFTLLTTYLSAFSQEIEMADELRENGKIFVVVIVIGIIVLGLYAYLFYLDKQLSKLEKNSQEK